MADQKVSIAITAATADAVGALRNLSKELESLGGGTEKAATRTKSATSQMETSWARMAASMQSAIAGLAIGSMVKDFISTAMEVDRLSRQFTVFSGSAALAAKEIQFIKDQSNRLGLDTKELTSSYALFLNAIKGTVNEGQKGRNAFIGISEGMAAVGMSAEMQGRAWTQLNQGIMKGKFELEDLKTINEAGLPIFKLMADALGITTEQFMQLQKEGKILANDVLPKLGDSMHAAYGVAALEGAMSAQGALNKFNNAMRESKSVAGASLVPAFTDLLLYVFTPMVKLIGDAVRGLQSLAAAGALAANQLMTGLGGIFSGKAFTKDGYRALMAESLENESIYKASMDKIWKGPTGSDYSAAEALRGANNPKSTQKTGKDTKSVATYIAEESEMWTKGFDSISKEMDKFNKEYLDSLKETSIDTGEEWGKGFTHATGSMEKFFKDYYGAQQVAIEDQLAAINALEAAYKLSPDDAAAQRIAQYQKSIALLKEQGNTGHDALGKIRSENEKILQQQKQMYDRTALGGMTNALEEYGRTASDVGAQVKSAFSGAFKTLEDSFTKFLLTGKLSLKSFFDSIKQSLAQMASQKIMLSIGTSIGSSLFGTAASAAGSMISGGGSGGGSGMTSGLLGAGGAAATMGNLGAGLTAGWTGVSAASTTAAVGASTSYGIGASLGSMAATVAPFAAAAAAAYVIGKYGFGIGNKWQANGVNISSAGGSILSANNEQKKEGGWFTSDDYSTKNMSKKQIEALDLALGAVNEGLRANAEMLGQSTTEIDRIMMELKVSGHYSNTADFMKSATDAAILALMPDIGHYQDVFSTITTGYDELGNAIYETVKSGTEYVAGELTRAGEDIQAAYTRIMKTAAIDTELKKQILEIQGLQDTGEYLQIISVARKQELVGLENSTKALKENLWALQEQATAVQKLRNGMLALAPAISTALGILNAKMDIFNIGETASQKHERLVTALQTSTQDTIAENARAYVEDSQKYFGSGEAFESAKSFALSYLDNFSGYTGDATATQKQINYLSGIEKAINTGNQLMYDFLTGKNMDSIYQTLKPEWGPNTYSLSTNTTIASNILSPSTTMTADEVKVLLGVLVDGFNKLITVNENQTIALTGIENTTKLELQK